MIRRPEPPKASHPSFAQDIPLLIGEKYIYCILSTHVTRSGGGDALWDHLSSHSPGHICDRRENGASHLTGPNRKFTWQRNADFVAQLLLVAC